MQDKSLVSHRESDDPLSKLPKVSGPNKMKKVDRQKKKRLAFLKSELLAWYTHCWVVRTFVATCVAAMSVCACTLHSGVHDVYLNVSLTVSMVWDPEAMYAVG